MAVEIFLISWLGKVANRQCQANPCQVMVPRADSNSLGCHLGWSRLGPV